MVPAERTVWTLIDIETTKNQEQLVQLGYAETANLLIRRDVFERLGGLEDSLSAHADFDLAHRVVESGGRLAYAPDALAWHPTRDSAGPILRFHWKANRAWAARTSRAGGRPHALTLRSWVPVIPVARARRRFGAPLSLERRWLGANGVQPTLPEEIKAAPINYLLLPYLRLVAQCAGWVDGRRLRREAPPGARSADA
jgi:GT2 family glycosyltransferase